jgi:DNA repair protein RecO (recombination protein O)
MALIQDRSICLRKVEYSETSQILLLLTREHGLVRVIAKGAHRRTKAGASKFDGGADLLDIGNAVFTDRTDKDLATLCEWGLREGHLDLRRSLRGMYLAQYAAELIALLFEEHDPHPNLFDRLQLTMPELATDRREEAFLAFELDLLRESGYLPELSLCVSCGRHIREKGTVPFPAGNEPAHAGVGGGGKGDSPRVWFSPASGGVICRNCEGATRDRVPVDTRLVGMMQNLLRLPRVNGQAQRLPRLTRHQTDPINRLLAQHVEHTLQRPLRLRGYVLGRM